MSTRSAVSRQIIHVDMDAFFASVEQLDRPELKNKAVIVGGRHRGVVCAASYPARIFGVHSAMPMSQALRLCPDAFVVFPRHHRYQEVSREVFKIFRRYTPMVEGLSLDEAFLDVTQSLNLFGSGRTIASQIREAIESELGLIASAGIGPNKFIAKIASDLHKPNALCEVRPEEVSNFLSALPVSRLIGVGRVQEAKVLMAGYRVLGDLARASTVEIVGRLGDWGLQLQALAQGVDPREVLPHRRAKSVSVEETFAEDITSREDLRPLLLAQALSLAQRLNKAGVRGRTLVLKLKDTKFRISSRQQALPEATDSPDMLYGTALTLLDKVVEPFAAIRLCGLGAHDLDRGLPEPTLFLAVEDEKKKRVELARRALESRFGAGTLTRASVLRRLR